MKTIAQKINLTQVQIVKIMLSLVVMLILLYLYLVNYTAFGAAAQERISVEISSVQSEIGELELAIIQRKREVNKGMAGNFNLVTVRDSELTFAHGSVRTRLTINE